MPTLLLRGKPIGSIKGVLFDKDGTLSNSEDHLLNLAKLRILEISKLLKSQNSSFKKEKEAKELLCKAYGLTNEELSPNGALAIGSRETNLISTATVLCLLGETWPKALEMSNQAFHLVDGIDKKTGKKDEKRSLLPGVNEILKSLCKANVICAVISNDSIAGIQEFLIRNNIKEFLKHFWSAEHHPTKPSPAAVIELCKEINLQPYECALVGDADSDLLMARKSGIGITLGYRGGWSKQPNLTKHQYLINSWDELSIL